MQQPPFWCIERMDNCIGYLETRRDSLSSDAPLTIPRTPHNSDSESIMPVKRSTNVKINRITTLEVLYEYPVGYILEYPETSSTGSIGHLFCMDPNDWQDPTLNIAYSRGGNMAKQHSEHLSSAISSSTLPGNELIVPNAIRLSSNADELGIPHTKATREDVRERLRKDREERLQYVSPSRDIFLKTLAYITAIQKLGCSRPLFEATGNISDTEAEMQEARELYLSQTQCGYRMEEGICEGRVVFDYTDDGRPYISCKHYNPKTNKDHLHDASIGDGSYHIEYLEAIFCGDEQEAAQIEESAFNLGYGPLTDCSTVANCSQQKAYCPFPHRDNKNNLVQPLMKRLPCTSKFRVFEPKQEFRTACPFILIVTHGPHPHPVPLPTKTPPKIRVQIFDLLGKLAEDLPNITPRRFIRHPIVQSFLASKFPLLVSPTLADCTANSHPGVVNLKVQQDMNLPKDKHYIRRIIAIDAKSSPRHEEDEDDTGNKDEKIRIIICMTPEASRRLRCMGRYLQSDIGFTRIARFLEFELACMDRDANANAGYGDMVLSWTADQHRGQAKGDEVQLVDQNTSSIQFLGLGLHLQKIASNMPLKPDLHQHTSSIQFLGLGLHLQKIASNMPLKPDLHQPERNIQDLNPYEHLCASIPRLYHPRFSKHQKMRCIGRASIREKGGKAGNAFRVHRLGKGQGVESFFFPGICWERSFIPLDIWNAGDSNSNLVESVHSDVNREGVYCTLLGGLQKARRFDALKMKPLITYENYGIAPSYKTGHIHCVPTPPRLSLVDRSRQTYQTESRRGRNAVISENMYNNLKRKANSQHNVLAVEDQKIERYNEKLLSF
ncbi:hypothetical protein C8J57DRAFT_1257262 [Mycena rebaudengoi]|nr:hypothetical protein C8J57DRAFT_1257262 [Mycena rebaudengoi]